MRCKGSPRIPLAYLSEIAEIEYDGVKIRGILDITRTVLLTTLDEIRPIYENRRLPQRWELEADPFEGITEYCAVVDGRKYCYGADLVNMFCVNIADAGITRNGLLVSTIMKADDWAVIMGPEPRG